MFLVPLACSPTHINLNYVFFQQAANLVFASLKEREKQGVTWDNRILDIDHVDFQNATVVNDVPSIVVTFVCQQVECHRDKEGKIVKGSETAIQNVTYVWALRRDFESEHFDYKIMEMHSMAMLSLV